MDPNISFDPNVLNSAEQCVLKDKVRKIYDAPDPDGCLVFKMKARKKKKKVKYPPGEWKIGVEFAVYFGATERAFNPASIAYSLHHSVPLYKQSNIDVSHSCGYVLCMNVEHLTMESHEINTSRRTCHKKRGIPWVCQHVPQCIIKTVDMRQ